MCAHTHTHIYIYIYLLNNACGVPAIMSNGLHCISKFLHDTSQQIKATTLDAPPSSELLYSIKNYVTPVF